MSNIIAALTSSYKDVSELLSYDPVTGEFMTLKKICHLYEVGQPRPVVMRKSGSGPKRHPAIVLFGSPRRATHIAHLLMTKRHLPKDMGIFIKGDPTDMRWENMAVRPLSCGGRI